MSQKWRTIWNKREAEHLEGLDSLIKLDGFDSGAGKIEEEDWRTYTGIIGRKLQLKDGHSIFEVGCGSGAFLYSLQDEYDLDVGGLDYGKGLIEAARKVMPRGNWFVKEAIDLDPKPRYDFVIAHGVFHYMKLEYAESVFNRMVQKARIGVAVMDIPDRATKEESERARRDALTVEEYKKKYEGLEHTYYPKEWFTQQAEKHQFACEIFDGCVPNYLQNRFRFGAIFRKRQQISD